ncbi:MAG: C25 family cysteine peptidase [Burkholderiales bacterium]
MHLAIASRTAITNALGPAALTTLEPLFERYLAAARDGGTDARLLMIDDASSMETFGLEPLGLASAELVRTVVANVRKQARQALESLLLLGGHSMFPLFAFTNPVLDRLLDPDAVVESDNPYGVLDTVSSGADWLAPSIPVGRIYDSGSVDAFAQALSAVIARHEAKPARAGSLAIYNADWMDVSLDVARNLPGPVDSVMAPPYEVGDNVKDLEREVLYVNLHGFSGVPGWQSYDSITDRFIDVLTPRSFTPETSSGTFLLTETCYGAQVVGRTPQNSCALSAHTNGATVVGATGLVWGSVLKPWAFVADGDALAQCVFQHLNRGGLIGAAFKAGRDAFLAGRTLNPFEQKTALQFILLGDPSLPV